MCGLTEKKRISFDQTSYPGPPRQMVRIDSESYISFVTFFDKIKPRKNGHYDKAIKPTWSRTVHCT